MQSVWTQGLDEKEKAQAEQDLRAAIPTLHRLYKILSDKYSSVERKGFREEDYRNSDWVHLSAFHNGKLSTLKEIAELITLDKSVES
jgi:hypothetical protein